MSQHNESGGRAHYSQAGDETRSTPAETAEEVPQVDVIGRTVEEAREEAVDWQDKYLRLYAEMENTKKRLQRHYASQAEQAKERMLLDLLPVVDNLERALEHAPKGGADKGLRSGIELTLRLFLDTLEKYGVVQIDAQNKPFNPELHEAISVVRNEELPPSTVAAVELKGYLIEDRLLRAARVLVTEGEKSSFADF